MNKKLWMVLLFSAITLYIMSNKQHYQCPGSLILINGVPSVGKSTICKHLATLIKDRKVVYLSLDRDVLPEVAFEQALKLGLIHNQMSEDEIRQIIIANIETIFQESVQTRWIEPSCQLFKKARNIACEGNVVLLDTVVGICENGADWIAFKKMMKGIRTFTALVYCPLDVLAQRIALRNSLNDPAEHRDPYNTMLEFCWMYRPTTINAQAVAVLEKNEMLKAMDLIKSQLIQAGMCESDAIEKVQNLQSHFEQTFFNKGQKKVLITSRMHHDCIFHTLNGSGKESAEMVYKELAFFSF